LLGVVNLMVYERSITFAEYSILIHRHKAVWLRDNRWSALDQCNY